MIFSDVLVLALQVRRRTFFKEAFTVLFVLQFEKLGPCPNFFVFLVSVVRSNIGLVVLIN